MLTKLALEALKVQLTVSDETMILLEHSEFLGRAGWQMPATIWRWPATLELQSFPEVQTGAFHQSDFGCAHAKPTRLLVRMPGATEILTLGDVVLDRHGRYQGPLTARPETPSLIGRSQGRFRTQSKAAWPQQM